MNYKLPPLPEPAMAASLLTAMPQDGVHGPLFTTKQMQEYAQSALDAREDWALLRATQESLGEHMAEMNRLRAEVAVLRDANDRWRKLRPAAHP